MRTWFRTLAVTLLGAASGAHACDYCLISQGISPLQTQNGAGIKLAQRYTLLDSVYAGHHKVDNPGAKEEYWTTELGAFYSFTDRFLMLLNVPLRKTKGDGELVEGPDGEPEREDSTGGATGLGDVSVLGRYTLSANLLAALPGEGETGDTSHKFGTSLNYDITGKYRLTPSVIGASSNQWFASLGVNGEYRRHEQLGGEKLDDTGGQTIYLTPGIQYVAGSHWVLEGAYQYAVFHDLNETQLGEDYKVFGSVTYLF